MQTKPGKQATGSWTQLTTSTTGLAILSNTKVEFDVLFKIGETEPTISDSEAHVLNWGDAFIRNEGVTGHIYIKSGNGATFPVAFSE